MHKTDLHCITWGILLSLHTKQWWWCFINHAVFFFIKMESHWPSLNTREKLKCTLLDSFKVTVYLFRNSFYLHKPNNDQSQTLSRYLHSYSITMRCLTSRRWSRSCLNYRYLNPNIKLKLLELAIKLCQEF